MAAKKHLSLIIIIDTSTMASVYGTARKQRKEKKKLPAAVSERPSEEDECPAGSSHELQYNKHTRPRSVQKHRILFVPCPSLFLFGCRLEILDQSLFTAATGSSAASSTGSTAFTTKHPRIWMVVSVRICSKHHYLPPSKFLVCREFSSRSRRI